MKKIIATALLIYSSSFLYTMNDEGCVEINGEYRHISDHIKNAQIDAQQGIENPLTYLVVLQYDPVSNDVTPREEGINLSDENLKEIESNNFVYVPLFDRAEGNECGANDMGAVLITGTDDPGVAENLINALRSWM